LILISTENDNVMLYDFEKLTEVDTYVTKKLFFGIYSNWIDENHFYIEKDFYVRNLLIDICKFK
jgi:hypothetical protein